MQKYKKILLCLLLISITAKPANAGPLEEIVNTLNREINRATSFAENLISNVNKVAKDIGIKVENEKGDLGLLDLEKTEESIEKQLDNQGKLSESEILQTIVESKTITNHADSILGKSGQETTMQNQTAVTNSVKLVSALEAQANGSQITQEVMKQIAAQNSQIAAINSSVYNSLEGLKQTTAYNNRAIARQLKQKTIENLQDNRQQQALNNQELTAISILQNNLYSTKKCEPGQKVVFITQVDGQTIPPRKTCQ